MCVSRFVLTSLKLCLKMHCMLNLLLTGRILLVIMMIIYVWTTEIWLRLTEIHEYVILLNSVVWSTHCELWLLNEYELSHKV